MKGILFASARRFVEMLLWMVILSALIFGLYKAEVIMPTTTGCFVSLMIGAILFWLQNFRWLCRCRVSVPSRRIYLIVNYVPYAVIMIISYIILAFYDSQVYTWLFSITKFLKYGEVLSFDTGTATTVISSFVFHLITLLLIWFAPYSIESALKENNSWRDVFYTATDAVKVVTAPEIGLSDEVRQSVLINLFAGATVNDVNRMLGLPIVEEDEEDEEEDGYAGVGI
ncbi:MAG: hypothetical protein IJH37_03705 [Clostridia bacterium]|nr:hypothetical protein [Clostridia bacterium]